VRLPALRERGRDALLLARHFLERAAREYGRGPLRLTPEAGAAIAAYTWPGNVRELQNAMAQAAALCEGDGLVTVALLPDAVRTARRTEAPAGDYRARVDAHRRDLITDALDRTGGNRSRAARNLGLSRQALLYLIRELKVPDRRRGSGA
jgi:DNA-binding NtrC family response regulator